MKTVLIYSGGLDSTVLLYHLLDLKAEVACLTVDYGQRHRVEIEHARKICARLGVEHRVADMRGIADMLEGSSLTTVGVPVPEGHYQEMSMRATVVPNRNMLMLSIASAWAISRKFDNVAYAAHSGDHAIYPDCRQVFVDAMGRAIELADWHELMLLCPFVGMTKADIVARGNALKVLFQETWSCYQGQELHCGRCGTCIERREAFYLAGVKDETHYADGVPSVDDMVASGWKL